MLGCCVKLLMEGVQSTNKAIGGSVIARALSTKTFVVKHDDVQHMFYIQLDHGLSFTAVTPFLAQSRTVVPCKIAFFWGAQNCPATGIIYVYIRSTEVQENKIKLQGSSLPKQTTVLYPDHFTSLCKVYCHVLRFWKRCSTFRGLYSMWI